MQNPYNAQACALQRLGEPQLVADRVRSLAGEDDPDPPGGPECRDLVRLGHDGEPGVASAPQLPEPKALCSCRILGGERTPNRPRAAAVFAGLRSHHGRGHLVRAVVEGATFGLAYAVPALQRAGVEVEQVTLIGGGAASDAWAQTCADIFGVPVEPPALPEAAGLGAALSGAPCG
jgi:xylulokinase